MDGYIWLVTRRSDAVHVATIKRKQGDKVYESVLLRRSVRDGPSVRHVTLGNISHLPPDVIDLIRRSLKGEKFVPACQAFPTVRSLGHGHVEAILSVMEKTGFADLIASRPSRKRDLVLSMVSARLLFGTSKLSTVNVWKTTTLPDVMGVADADEDELYSAMDWLLSRQEAIEKRMAQKHMKEGDFVLTDTSTTFYTGRTCPLARYGHDKDGSGEPVILFGVLANQEGIPVAVKVYPGNTGDPSTLPDAAETLKTRFGLSRMVLVGDRGLLTSTQIETLKKYPDLAWISALRSEGIRKLVESGTLQLSLFDERNLMEIHSNDYPGERLIACFNPLLCEERRRKRVEFLLLTEKNLSAIAKEVGRRTKTPLSADEIGIKVGKVIGKYKMAKHFTLDIRDGFFSFEQNAESIQEEARLDGIYLIRTSADEKSLPAADAVRRYKSLSFVETAFRTLKSLDIRIRPIYHRTEDRVRAHVFLCLLAYYVEWHLRKAWAPLLYADEHLEEIRPRRDPVAPAKISPEGRKKKASRKSVDGFPLCTFTELLEELGTRRRETVRVPASDVTFERFTEPTPFQERALGLLQ